MNIITKISVIIPVYNSEEHLCQCLDSVINQTLSDIEIICVDDGSTDHSLTILTEYTKNDARIILIKQPHKGVSTARNTGYTKARGKYIYFLDNDDFIDSTAFEKLTYELDEKELDLIYFDCGVFYESSDTPKQDWVNFHSKYPATGVITGAELINLLFERNELHVSVGRTVYKHEFLIKNNIQFLDGMIHEDIAYTFETLMKATRVLHLPDIYYYWRIRTNSISHRQPDSSNVRGWFFNLIKLFTIIKELDIQDNEHKLAAKKYIEQFYNGVFWIAGQLTNEERNKLKYSDDIYENILFNLLYGKIESDMNHAQQIVECGEHMTNLNKQIKELNEELLNQNQQLQNLNQVLLSLQSSKSYKIGRMITWAPRKLRTILSSFLEL